MRFEFATATRIIFGEGTIQEAGQIAAEFGSCSFVITGRTNDRARVVVEQLKNHNIKYEIFNVTTEPTTTMVKQAVEKARGAKSDLVIGIGGGSAMDTGKAVAAMLTNTGGLEDYLEVVGQGKQLTDVGAPYIAIPTTAGTGAEVTRNSVISACEHKVKVSMRSPFMLPKVALVDPALTYSMPPEVTASTGLDALTQLMEVYVSNKANPLTDGICAEGLKRAGRSLLKAYQEPNNSSAREDMALASLFGGLALANAKLGAVHGFAGPLGGMIDAPHGVICASLLPFVFETNIKALQTRKPNSASLARFDEVSRLLTGNDLAKADDGQKWLKELCKELTVQPLSKFGLKEKNFALALAKAGKSSSMKGNPITLTEDELKYILFESL